MSRDWEGERRREGRTEKEMELARRSAPRSKDRGQDCSSVGKTISQRSLVA